MARHRKAGARYPGGKLKPQPVAPNERVMADRERLMGSDANLQNADHAMDLALARGWLTEAQHRAGMTYARLHRQAQLGAPGLDRSRMEESPGEALDVQAKGLQDWTDAETAAVFDAVFNRAPPSGAAEAANAKLRTLNAILTPDERAEVTDCFVRASWPQWVVQRAHGHFATGWERKRDLLVRGLSTLVEKLKPERSAKAPADIPFSAMALAPVHGPKREESTRYVTPEGELIREVVVRRRVTS